MLVTLMRANIQQAQVAALAYAGLGLREAATKALDAFEGALFPFNAPTQVSSEKMQKRLFREMQRGPIAVRRTPPPKKFKSSLLRRRSDASPATNASFTG